MTEWEYDIREVIISGSDQDKKLLKILNEYGLLGWECYCIEENGILNISEN